MVVFSPTFVADTKMIFRYDFVALSKLFVYFFLTEFIFTNIKTLWSSSFENFNCIEAVAWRCSVKRVFLEILQNSLKKLLKKRLWHRCFPVNFAKFLGTPFPTKHLQWLVLTAWTLKISQCKQLRYYFPNWIKNSTHSNEKISRLKP